MKSVLDIISDYQSSAPVDVEGLIRTLGVELEKSADLDSGILGQIAPAGGAIYRITVNKKDHYFRQRFTMAHELGHYLMHRHLIREGTDDDKAYRSTDVGNFHNRLITPAHEVQANQFAANLLMPSHLVSEEWQSLRPDLKEMAKAFQVSPAAMRIRLEGIFGPAALLN